MENAFMDTHVVLLLIIINKTRFIFCMYKTFSKY
jgi:hypothetical protein